HRSTAATVPRGDAERSRIAPVLFRPRTARRNRLRSRFPAPGVSFAESRVDAVELAQQARPRELSSEALRHLRGLLLRGGDDLRMDVREFAAAGLRAYLDGAGRLEDVHRQEGVGDVRSG